MDAEVSAPRIGHQAVIRRALAAGSLSLAWRESERLEQQARADEGRGRKGAVEHCLVRTTILLLRLEEQQEADGTSLARRTPGSISGSEHARGHRWTDRRSLEEVERNLDVLRSYRAMAQPEPVIRFHIAWLEMLFATLQGRDQAAVDQLIRIEKEMPRFPDGGGHGVPGARGADGAGAGPRRGAAGGETRRAAPKRDALLEMLFARLYLCGGQAAVRLHACEQAEAWLHTAIGNALQCAGRGEAIAVIEGAAFRALGRLASESGRPREALDHLQIAHELQERHGRLHAALDTRLAVAELWIRLGFLGHALRRLQHLRWEAASLSCPRIEARLLCGLCRVRLYLGLFDAAGRDAVEALRCARRRGTPAEVIRALLTMVAVHVHRGTPGRPIQDARIARLLSRCRRFLERLKRSGVEVCELEAAVAWGEALGLVARGEFAAADAMLAELLVWAERTNPAGGREGLQIAAQRLRGEALLAEGRWAAAAAALRRSLELSIRFGDRIEQGLSEIGLAKALGAPPANDRAGGEVGRLLSRGLARLVSAGVPREHLDCDGAGPAMIRSRAPLAHPRRAPAARPPTGGPPAASRAVAEACRSRPEYWHRFGIITRSPEVHAEMLHLSRVARSDLPVLIHGETGSGKELAAAALHEMSGRAGRFVTFNAATARNELLEAELFGHRKGAFTGAHRDRPGLIAQAEGGTLFLDEVADLHPAAQAALLRFLDTGEVRAVGADRAARASTRIVAASLRSLRREVARDHFRQDLYFRLAGAEIRLPPLRRRPEDLLPLVHHFATRRQIPPGALEDLLADGLEARLRVYRWPGNVREVLHWVDQLAALWRSRVPLAEIRRRLGRALAPAGEAGGPVPKVGRGAEGGNQATRADLIRLLRIHRGNISAVARDLCTYRTHVYRMLRVAGIDLHAQRRASRANTLQRVQR